MEWGTENFAGVGWNEGGVTASSAHGIETYSKSNASEAYLPVQFAFPLASFDLRSACIREMEFFAAASF